jgi:hypothetical protein
MNDDLLDDCLIIFIERDIFLNVNEEAIINSFMVGVGPIYEQKVYSNILFNTLYVCKIF